MAARLASKALHDARALDWQAERENLIDPRKPTATDMLTGGRRGGKRRGNLEASEYPKASTLGYGATPTMGLSQQRGGAKKSASQGKHIEPLLLGRELGKHLLGKYGDGYAKAFVGGAMSSCGGGMKGGAINWSNIDWNAPWSWNDFFEGFKEGAMKTIGVAKYALPLAGEEGKQIKEVIDKLGFGRRRGGNLSKSGPYEGHGHMEGGVWPFDEGDIDWNAPWSWDDFAQGFQTGFKKTMGVGKNVLPLLGPEGVAIKGAVDALGFGKGGSRVRKMRGGGGIVGGASWNGEPGPEAYQAGPALDQARAQAQATASRAAMSPTIGGRARRRGAGPGDGRKARAEIVREVMNKHGLKLIEASKYVKTHGLYKGKGSE